jgi:fibronectin-binding autotransporter adhesin
MKTFLRNFNRIFVVFYLLLLSFKAYSTTYYSKATGDMNTVSNWNTQTDGLGTDATTFTGTHTFIIQSGHTMTMSAGWGLANNTLTVSSGGTIDLNSYTLSSNITTFTIAGTGNGGIGAIKNGSASLATCQEVVNLSAAATIMSSGTGGMSFTGNIVNGGFDLTLDGSYSITIGTGVISGNGGIIKNGSGTTALSGTNTFIGVVTLNAGTLQAGTSAQALGTGAATLTLAGGILLLQNSTALNFARNTTVTGSCQITTNRAAGGAGVTHTLGTLSIGNYTLTVLAGSNATSGTQGLTFGAVTHTAAPTYTVTNSAGATAQLSVAAVSNSTFLTTFNGDGNVIQTGVFGNGTGGITYSGTGTLTLSQANTYSGATTISSGKVNLQNATATGTTAGGVTVASGAELQLQGASVGAEALSLLGTGSSSTGALRFISGTNVWGGAITLGATGVRINADAGTNSITGGITGTGYSLTVGGAGNFSVTTTGINTSTGGTLTKDGAGTVTLSASCDYTGATTISAGAITLGASNILNDATAMDITGTFNLGGNSETVGSIAGSGTIDGVSGAPTLTCGGDNTTTIFSGVLTDAAGALILTKNGSGTLTLSGGSTNTHSGGTILNAGQLNINKATAAGSSTFTINGGVIDNTSGGTISITNVMSIAASFTFTGSNALTQGTGAITLTTTPTITCSSSTLTLGGIIGGGFGITKAGSGILALSGANTFTGVVTLNAGTLQAGTSAQALGTGAATLTLAGGILLLQNTTALNFARNTTVTGSCQITTNRAAGGAGVTHTLGTLSIGNYTLTVLAGSNATSGTQGLTFGAVTHTAAPTYTVTNSAGATAQLSVAAVSNSTFLTTFNGDGNVIQTGVFGNGTGGITYSGTGKITLDQANTFTGGFTLSSGTVNLNNNSALGTTAGTFTIGANTTIDNTSAGSKTLVNYPIIMNSFTFTGTASGTLSLGAGAVTLASSTTITQSSASVTLTIGGIIDDGASTYNFATSGAAGAIILSGANTYGGSTTVNSGSKLTLGAAGVIPDASALTVEGTFNLGGFSETVGSIAGAGTIDGVIGAPTLTCGGDNTTTIFSGVLTDAAGALILTKNGSGTLTLSGGSTNTHSGGTILNAGQLNINKATAAGSSTFTINGGVIDNTSGGTISITNVMSIAASFTFTGSNALTQGTGAITLTTTPTITCSASTLTLGGVIGGGFGITKDGNGTLKLSGANNYTGAVTINAGILQLGSTGALGTVAGGVVVNSGSTLDLVSYTVGTAEPLTLNGTGYSSSGALYFSSGTISYSGAITLGSASTIKSSGTQITLTGGVTNGGFDLTFDGSGISIVSTTAITGNGGLIMSGSGITRISVACTYAGTTTVSAGRLENGASNVFPNTGLILSGGTYANALTGATATSYTETFGTLTMTASSTIDFATTSTTQDVIFSNSSAASWTGTLTVTDWNGTQGIAGTKGQLFFGTDATGLTAAQLIQLSFTGYGGDGAHIASGEFVPSATLYYYKTIVSSGNWSSTSTWNRSLDNATNWISVTQVPSSGMTAGVTVDHDVTFDVSASIDLTTISASKTLTISSGITMTVANGTGTDLTVYGTIVVDGTLTKTGTVVLESGGYYNNANGTMSVTNLTCNDGSTVEISGTSTISSALSGSFYHFIWSTNQTYAWLGSGDTETIRGNLTVSGGHLKCSSHQSGARVYFYVTGNVVVSGGTLTVHNNTDEISGGGCELTVTGNVTVSGGTLDMIPNGVSSSYLTIAGNLIHSSGTLYRSGSTNAAYIRFNGGGTTQTWNSDAGSTYQGLQFHVGISASTTATVQISSNIIIGTSSTLTVNTTTGNTGTLIIPAAYVISGVGTFTTSSGSILKIANTNGIVTAGTNSGAIQTTTRTYNGACNYHYTGTAAQATGTGLPTTLTTPGGLTINNSQAINSSNTGVSLTQTTTISTGTVTLTAGVLTTATGTLLTITNTSTSAISNGSSATYINGPMMWTVSNTTATYIFPTGKNGVYYPFTNVSHTSGTSQAPTVEAFAGSTGGTPPASFTLSTVAYWKVIYSANAFTGEIIKIDETASISGKTAIGYCTTVNGTYATMGGTTSGTTITSTSATGSLNNVIHFYVMMGVGTYYKRAGSGDWTNTNSWSSTSGGAADIGGYPSGTNVIVLDANSGDLNIDAAVTGADLTIADAYTGTISGTGTISLSGNLSVGTGLTAWSGTGAITLTGSAATITSNGKTLTPAITINSSGTVTLVDALTNSGDIILTAGTLASGNYTISTGGNWTNNGGSFTEGTGAVTFTGSSSTINGTAATETFYNLICNKTAGQTLSTGGSITSLSVTNNFTETTGHFTAPATMSIGGATTLTAGTFTAPSGVLTLSGNFTDNGGTFTHNNGTVTFTGSDAAINGTDNSETFYTMIVNKTAGQTLSTGGSMATITVDNTFTQTLGNFTAPATMTITGAATLTTGTFTAPSSSLTLASTLTDNGTTFTHNSGTVTFTGSSSAINGTDNSETFNNVIVNKTAGQTLSTGGSMVALTCDGTFTETLGNFTAPATMTITGNTTLTAGTFTAPSGTLTLAGNLTDNGATFTHNSGTVTFTGSDAAINGTDNSETFNVMVVNKTVGQTLSTGGSMATITCASTFTQTQGNFTAPATMNVTGVSTLTTGTFTAPSGTLTLSDNLTNNGATFTHNNGTVVMNGASKTLGGTTGNTFYNLTISGATTLGAAQTVNNTMSLGTHLTASTYDLTIGASGVFSGYSNTAFVITSSTGKVTQNSLGTGAAVGKQVFPIGYSSATTDYTPCVMDNTGTTDNISVYVSSGRLASGTSGLAKTSHCVDRSWHVSEAVVGGSTVTMTLQWDVARELTSFTRANCYIGHWNGASWDTGITAGSSSNVSGTIYEISRASISSFSPFDVEDPDALPITLIDFKAKQEGEKVRLDWETGTEENNEYFTIERSIDGKYFEKVFTKDGAGTSKTNLYYFGYDNKPYTGVSYYRLKQTDLDGKFAYSDIESVNFTETEKESTINMAVYPNPAIDNTFHIDFSVEKAETYYISMYDELGKLIHFETVEAEKGKNTLEVKLPGIASGMYVLELRSDSIGVEKRNVKL